MYKELFLTISEDKKRFDINIDFRVDAHGKGGLSTIQKCASALRMISYGQPADAVDDYIKIGKSTANFYMERFCENIISFC